MQRGLVRSFAHRLVPLAAIPAHGSHVDAVTVDNDPDARPAALAIKPHGLDVDLATLMEKIESLSIEGGRPFRRDQ